MPPCRYTRRPEIKGSAAPPQSENRLPGGIPIRPPTGSRAADRDVLASCPTGIAPAPEATDKLAMTQAPSPDDASPLARRGRPWHWQLALKGLRARLDVHHQAAFTDLDVIMR